MHNFKFFPQTQRGYMLHSSAQVRPIRVGIDWERRRQPRLYLPVSVRVSCLSSVSDSRIAVMRDANICGAFFFCDLDVAIGQTVYIQLASQQAKSRLTVNCEASVVRVEKPAVNGLTGVAVEFYRFEVEDPAHASAPLGPLADWSVDSFDRMFAQRLELETCAFRIQGAA
ncbi:MAG: hypothetical protein DMG62_08500 [Acidobacteria bacterium]|nr:MAG: hypothetical protein DMG63_11165 [Acidobacteriota bacterium]PYY23400.1 MAG: hypothetical protein DMG62_08500 [Acidobacteriota bacterium]